MARSNSELQVITYAKKLSSYVMTITQEYSAYGSSYERDNRPLQGRSRHRFGNEVKIGSAVKVSLDTNTNTIERETESDPWKH